MTPLGKLLIAGAVSASILSGGLPAGREPSFKERVEAQQALERVYYAHQLQATLPFEAAVPPALLERKVRTYLKQSVALETFWKTRVTVEMLDREIERMRQATRMPDRLREIFAALGNDRVLIRECLARPVLVGRLIENFHAMDRRMHAEELARIKAIQARLDKGRGDASAMPEPEVVEYLSREEFGDRRADLPVRIGTPGQVHEEKDRFTVSVLRDESSDHYTVASYSVAKQPLEAWWSEVERNLDENAWRPAPEESPGLSEMNDPTVMPAGPTVPQPETTCLDDNVWDATNLNNDAPAPRKAHTAVWTGSSMIIWGGVSGGVNSNSGARYDPATDTWSPVSRLGAPSPRQAHVAVWTGSRMIVWGGLDSNSSALSSGGRYDPAADQWQPTAAAGAPPRASATAVWDGTRMIVWGGGFNTGGRYDPATDTWTPTSLTGAPSARYANSALWTGNRMAIWGGFLGLTTLGDGALYDPASDSWAPISPTNAPAPRSRHTAVWSGSSMIVWGGELANSTTRMNTGGRYDPVSNSWLPASLTGAPLERAGHSAVWTGTRMVVWGGSGSPGPLDSGGRYDPLTDSWEPTSSVGAPEARRDHTAVWTGNLMVIWGALQDSIGGGRYDPVADTWTPTSTGTAPSPRSGHQAIWTGNRMIVWGGGANTGGRYDPAIDAWSPTAVSGAPSARSDNTAVWTGSRMVVWGGQSGGTYFGDGGRYDPISDGWESVSPTDAPVARALHTAVWTGNRMIVWGGRLFNGQPTNTGGRYDPDSDQWIATNPFAAPDPRLHHTAVWTGNRMVIWGGAASTSSLPYFNTGGLYDPAADSWSPMSTSIAPVGRIRHTAVWTGGRMIVFGGNRGFSSSPPNCGAEYLDSGGRYDPATDQWSPMSNGRGRAGHSAVWTGYRMIVWGGYRLQYVTHPTFCEAVGELYLEDGAIYDPAADSWSDVASSGAPSGRIGHSAVWAHGWMMIWGGVSRLWPFQDGGRLSFGQMQDLDGDNAPACADCNDANPSVYPGAVELCDGLDNDCDGVVDEITDADGDGFTNCGGDCDETNAAVHPGAAEVCNGIDDNCNAAIDEGMPDTDGDGYDVCNDCNDANAGIHPGVIEACNGVDDNCNGIRDEGFTDQDSDGYGACVDCQDFDPAIHPGAVEVCNQMDDDCDTEVDEGFDQDGDGVSTCLGDCNDLDPTVWEAPVELFDLSVHGGSPTTLDWFDLGPLIGSGTTNDLASGPLTAGNLNAASAVCLQTGGGSSFMDARPDPAIGSAIWYLARARSSCGLGTFGSASNGAERILPVCP